MKIRCLLISIVILFATCILTSQSYAKIDPRTIVGNVAIDMRVVVE